MRRGEELELLEDDPTLFEAPPEWFLPELKMALRKGRDDDELGLRSLIERPEVLAGCERAAEFLTARGA